MLPNFICLGAQKAGTTTLHGILKDHDEIFLPSCKETDFFSHKYQHSGLNTIIYESSFFAEANHKAVGEFSPAYLIHEQAPKRMYDMLGEDLKLIITLRQPVNRAYSAYKMFNSMGWDSSATFKEAISNDKDNNDVRKRRYLEKSLYSSQIENYLKYFKKENMMFIIFEEEIMQNLDTTVYNIFKFLDVDTNFEFDSTTRLNIATRPSIEIQQEEKTIETNKKYFKFINKQEKQLIKEVSASIQLINAPHRVVTNPSSHFIDEVSKLVTPEKLCPEYKEQLMQEYFNKDISKLEKLIGRDLSIWK